MLRMINSAKINGEHTKNEIQFGKANFSLTLNVETRTVNVIENEAIRPLMPVKYCDVRI